MSKLMASVTNVHVNLLDFALASLALLSFVRSAAVSMSIEPFFQFGGVMCSLKTAMSCSNQFVRFDCFCVVAQGVCVLPYHFS